MKAQRLTQRATSILLVFLLLLSMATGVAAQSEVQTLSSDAVSLNYSDVAISLHSGYALPLYLTTEYFTEPSATGKVSWSSSDESVATVDADGRVHPVAVGVTTITARHADYPEQPVTCAVTVYQEAPCTTFYYLSPEGSDDNDGSEGSPFQTIEKARDTIRDLPELPVGGVTVILEDGKYPVTHTVEFAPEDSGTQANPIVYKARHQGKAILTGEVSIQGWQKAAVEVGMSEAAQGNLFVANIEKGWRFHDLYLDGERQQVSRSQNTDNWRVWPKFYGRAPISYDAEKGTKVVFANGELDGLQGNEDVELVLLPVMYWNSIPRVKHIDPANRTAYLQSKIPSNFWPEQFGTEEGFYNIINTLKYLDEPGEWCVDSAAGKVYYWPKDEQVLGTASLVAPKLYELLRLQGDGVEENFARLVEYITFDGISFQYTDRLPENEFPDDWIIRNAENPDAAVYFDGTQHCRLINGEVTRSGSYGVMINHYGQQNEVINNRLHDLGSGGVQIFGYGVGTVDVSYLNHVMYNTIYNMGVAPYQHSPGIGIFGSGRNTLAYNYIAGAPYAGISIVGTDENSVSATKPNVRAAYDLYGDQARQYGIRFEDLEALPAMERDGVNGEYFTIGTLAEKYQHSSRNVAEYNILDDYSQSMDDGGALYSWYCGLGNVYAYNVLKEELQGSRTWVFRLYMDDRALGFTLQNNQSTGNFGGTVDKSFAPYKNRWVNNGHAKFPLLPEGYTEQRTKILNHVQETVGGFNLPETVTPVILTPQNGDQNVSIPTSFTWQRCENAALYTLEIATDEAFAHIVASLQTKDTVATTDLLEYDTAYFGRLRTRELLQPGQVSEVISFKTGLQPPPTSAPRDMKVSNDIDAVLIQWTPVPKTTVNVYRKADGEDHYSLLVGNIPGTGYLDSSVVEKKRYSYIISAVNNSGEGPMSESADITTRELEVLFRDNFDDGKISDLWTDLQGKQANLNAADGKVIDGQWEPNSNWREYYVGLNNALWDNYAVEADITFKGLQSGAEAYSGFGLLTRANRVGGGKQFYQFIIRTKEKKMEFMKCNNNTWTTYTTVATAALPAPGDVFRMRAENVNNSIRIYLNGILFAEIEDASYASGGIGIGYGREYISIDNMRAVQPKQFPVTLANGMVGGTIEFQPTQAASGKTIYVSIIPDPGFNYKEGSLTMNGTPLQGLSFEMPEGGAVLFCEFEEQVKPARSEVYVATNGSDLTGDGSLDNPYATIKAAQAAIRAAIKEGLDQDATIMLREGVYYLDETIEIGTYDFDANHTITYTNYEEEAVRIVGGVPVTGWSDSNEDGIWEADVTGLGDFYALFDNGERLINAKEVAWKDKPVADISRMQAVYGGTTSWFGEVLKVSSLSAASVQTHLGNGSYSGSLQFLQGAREYINEPGEWAVAGATLYYMPLNGASPAGHEIVAPMADRIFHLRGSEKTPVENIVIQGLTLEMNDFGENLLAHAGRQGDKTEEYQSNLKGLMDLDYTRNITVRDCILKNAGYMAVVINHLGQDNTIYGNYIENTGYAGIFLIGENPGSLQYINKNNTISNNIIKNVGLFVSHGSGIYLINSGNNQITHNQISGVPRYGISMKGIRYGVFAANGITGVPFENHWIYNQTTENYIGYNIISDTGNRSGDGGGIEGWGIGRDNWIDHNIIYNAYRGVATTGWRGHSIFTDDATHHTMVTNNVVYDENAVAVNAGTMMKSISNYVANNVFDVGYAKNGAVNVGPYIEPSGGMVFAKNIVYSEAPGTLYSDGSWQNVGKGDRVMLKFDDGSYNVSGTKALESMYRMDNNLYYNAVGGYSFEILGELLSLEAWQNYTGNTHKYDAHSRYDNPGFVNSTARDYRLQANSPAFAMGIASVDTADIGLLPDYRFADTQDALKVLYLMATDNTQVAAALPQSQTVQLKAVARTEKGFASNTLTGVTFDSSNAAIASVDSNGLVRAEGTGTAVITATYQGKTDSYTVYADDRPKALSAWDIELQMGKNESSLASVFVETIGGKQLAAAELTFTSQDKSVATVDVFGRVFAEGIGKTSILVEGTISGVPLSAEIAVDVVEQLRITRNPYEKTKAVSADMIQNGASNQTSCVGFDAANSQIVFKDMNFDEGAKRFAASYATGNAARVGTIELRLDAPDGPVIGSVNCALTGAWGVYTDSWIDLDSAQTKGIHDLYVIAKPGAFNLATFQFSPYEAGEQIKSLDIGGSDIVGAPQSGTKEYTYTIMSVDDIGYKSAGALATWSLDADYKGIELDKNTGTLTAGTPDALKTNITIKAVSHDNPLIMAEKHVLVYDGEIVELTGAQADEKFSTGVDGISGIAFQGADSWIKYAQLDLKGGIGEYELKYSYPQQNTLSIRTGSKDAAPFTSVSLGSGSWSNYLVVSQIVTQGSPTGLTDLYLTQGNWLNFHWIRFYLPNDRSVKAAVSSTISTLVASYAANLPVSVYNPDGQTVTVRLTAPDQSILDSKNMTQTGSYLIRIDKAIAGTYALTAYVGDLLVSEATVNCVTPADTLWAPLMAVDGEVTTLTFGGMLSFKANEEVSVNGQKLPAIAYRLDGNQLILSRAVQEGQVIVIKGIRYPELFPSYSFTFTLTYTE